MNFIDWSDPEEMLGLLTEYVADARNESRADPDRWAALAALLEDLTSLIRSDSATLDEEIDGLRRIRGAHSEDLEDDPVLRHVEDCIGELERIQSESGA
jgi:hypothetical protein